MIVNDTSWKDQIVMIIAKASRLINPLEEDLSFFNS